MRKEKNSVKTPSRRGGSAYPKWYRDSLSKWVLIVNTLKLRDLEYLKGCLYSRGKRKVQVRGICGFCMRFMMPDSKLTCNVCPLYPKYCNRYAFENHHTVFWKVVNHLEDGRYGLVRINAIRMLEAIRKIGKDLFGKGKKKGKK